MIFLCSFHQEVTCPNPTSQKKHAWSCSGSAAAQDWPSPSAWLDCPIHKCALTTVLVDRHITDFIGRDVPVGLCRLSPAQLGHGGRHNIESQAPGLAGHWEQKQRGKSGSSGCPELLRSQLGCRADTLCSQEQQKLRGAGCRGPNSLWGHSPSSSVRQWMTSE